MKALLYAAGVLAASSLLFTGCKEVGPSVNLTPDDKGNYDSMYTLTPTQAAALTADVHIPLVEEFTGQNCNNCPSAHATLAGISGINAIGLYLYNIPQANPPVGAVYDFRDSAATHIGDDIYGGIGGLPSGGVDRLPITGTTVLATDRTIWSGNITSEKGVTPPVNIVLTSVYDAATATAKVKAVVTYTKDVSVKQNLSVVLTEDGMIDLQEFPAGVQSGYRFTDVFRDMISTAPYGSGILDSISVKKKGTVLMRVFKYKLKTTSPAIVPDSCNVVAFVSNNNGTDKVVVQSAKVKFK